MNKIYIIKYCGGSHDDWYSTDVFVTDKKITATRYVTKFNNILKKWKEYYKQYEEKNENMNCIKDEYLEHFERWDNLQNITKCYFERIELR